MHSHIIISSANLKSNAQVLRSQMPSTCKFIAVVKGNAYGIGLGEVVKILSDSVDGFQVGNVSELEEIRAISTKPVYVLGYVDDESLQSAIKLSCVLSVFDKERLPRIDSIAKSLQVKQKVHIKIDALLGRLGLFPHQVAEFLDYIKTFSNIEVTGVYSHLTALKDHIDMEHTRNQIKTFKSVLPEFESRGYKNLETHISSSAGVLIDEIINDSTFNCIRIGKALYGVWPSLELERTIDLKPVLQWKSQVAQVKTFPQGYPIGYTATYKTEKDTVAAVIPQGYSDGYDKRTSAAGEVLIKGKRCAIIGKVAMNMFIVNISGLDGIIQGDEVVLIGPQYSGEITIGELAEKTGSSNCEVLSRISPKIPRLIE